MTAVLNPIFIQARDLPDAWHQCIFAILEEDAARKKQIDRGSYAGEYRLEFDFIMGHVTFPGQRPLIPDIPTQYGIPNPVESMDYVEDYFARYLMSDVKEANEQYTYGERITAALTSSIAHIRRDETSFGEGEMPATINQVEEIIKTYRDHGYVNNQMIIQVGQPCDVKLLDPPCLRHIDTWIEEGQLHFSVYFRSWDLWGGFPANLAAIQLLKEYMASEIGVEDGEMMFQSKGLHLYGYTWEIAGIRRGLCEEEMIRIKNKS